MRRVRVALERFRRSKVTLVVVLMLTPAAPLAALFTFLTGCSSVRSVCYADLEQHCEYRWVSLYAIAEIGERTLLIPTSHVIRVHNDSLQTLVRVVCSRG